MASLSNPGAKEYDEIQSTTDFYIITSFSKYSVTFKAKSTVEIEGVAPTVITFSFKKDGVEVSTSQLTLSVGIPIHKPANDAINGLNVEEAVGPKYSSKFFLEATNYFNASDSNNVVAGVQAELEAKPFSFKVRTDVQALFADNQPNVTIAYGSTFETTYEAIDTDTIKHTFTAEINNLFKDKGSPVNNASIYTTLLFKEAPIWIFQSIGLDIGAESSVGTQHGIFYNEGGFIRVQLKQRSNP